MPFSGGTYTPPGLPDFPPSPGDVINSTYYTSVINDIADALSVTLLRDGTVALTGDLDLGTHVIKALKDGTVALPSLGFNTNPATGMYLDSSGNVCFTLNGTQILKIGSLFAFFSAQVPQTMTYGATITPSLNASINYNLAMTGNAVLANPSAMTPGSSGVIVITQDATGSRLLTYGTQWHFPVAVPALSTVANSVDALYYYVATSGIILSALIKGYVHS